MSSPAGGDSRPPEFMPTAGGHSRASDSIFSGVDGDRSLFGWLVADGWYWFVLREEYCWLVAGLF
jgi:hypothetical protein